VCVCEHCEYMGACHCVHGSSHLHYQNFTRTRKNVNVVLRFSEFQILKVQNFYMKQGQLWETLAFFSSLSSFHLYRNTTHCNTMQLPAAHCFLLIQILSRALFTTYVAVPENGVSPVVWIIVIFNFKTRHSTFIVLLDHSRNAKLCVVITTRPPPLSIGDSSVRG